MFYNDSTLIHLELKSDRVSSEVGIELSVDVDRGRLPGGVLDHEEELGDDLDDVPRLEHEVALPLDGLGAQAPGDVGLTLQLPRWRRLKLFGIFFTLFEIFFCHLFEIFF